MKGKTQNPLEGLYMCFGLESLRMSYRVSLWRGIFGIPSLTFLPHNLISDKLKKMEEWIDNVLYNRNKAPLMATIIFKERQYVSMY